MATELILASASPRRREILTQLGIRFEVAAGEVDELTAGDAEHVARENATRKARVVAERSGPQAVVLGADTVVDLDGRLLPKPRDAAQAREWLQALSGREHRVVSAVCVARGGDVRTAVSATAVRFRALTGDEIDWYVSGGEWRDRAGGYAIHGRGAALVASICGDYWTVVGLPVPALVELVGPRLLVGG
jgi:septum formation protein